MRSWVVACAVAQIHILSPGGLVQKLGHDNIYGTTATFGTPYYGERVQGRLRYSTPTMNHNHCTEQGYTIDEWPGADSEIRRIIIVDRGECTFVSKVRIAQEYKGADAVIVVDNTDMTPDDIRHVIMADDGWGGGNRVRIPSILISKKEGEILKEAVKEAEEHKDDPTKAVTVELRWDIPESNVVSIDFWMSSANQEAADFLDAFKPMVDEMKYHVQFTPHFHVFSLPKNLNDLCSPGSDGKYCAPAPDNANSPIHGSDVLAEDLRQLCIWRQTRVPDPKNPSNGATFSPKYWDYLKAFHEQCPVDGSGDRVFGLVCSDRVQDQVGVDKIAVAQCTRTKEEELLKEERENVAWSPLALRLNGWRYSGPLEPVTVLNAVCSGFLNPPPTCANAPKITQHSIRHRVGVSFFHALVVFVCFLFLSVLLLALYKRFLRKSVRAALREEVMLEVRAQVSEYQALGDSGGGGRRF